MSSREYEVSTNLEYQAINREAWREFCKGLDSSPPSPEVFASWKRCQALGVDPYQKSVKRLLTPEELGQLQEKHRPFLEISRPMLESLYAFLADEYFVIALTDSSGWILDMLGNEGLKSSLSKGNWRAGADWSEPSAGNNIVGTAINLNKPVLIIGYEHYCRCSHNHAGAGAPIHDGNGNITGVISMASAYGKVHPHTLGMIVAAARAIETQLEMKQAWLAADHAKNQMSTIINTVADGLIGTDRNDKITFFNDNALRILGISSIELMGQSLLNLIPQNTLGKFHLKTKGSLDHETLFKVNGSYMKCICSCRHIMKNGVFQGLVLAVTEYSRAERLANKIANRDTFWTFDNLIGQSLSIQHVSRAARKAAANDSNILILGESGTGKDVFAQAIHNASARKRGPYVAINCAALPRELINSELFGYSEGAFTGARRGGSKGKVELANGGTLFLDEIGEMPIEQQTILLRLIENRRIQKIGSGTEIQVDIRIIAATNKDLLEEVEQQRFRRDLYYRLNVFTVNVPPLRERKDDIPELAHSFLDRLAERTGQLIKTIDSEVMDRLMKCDWPGNIRELQNTLERASLLADGPRITADIIPLLGLPSETVYAPPTPRPANPAEVPDNRPLTASYIEQVLESTNWNISKACVVLGISRPTMYRKLGQFAIHTKSQKSGLNHDY